MKHVIAIDFDDTIWDTKKKKIMNKELINGLFENPDNFIVIYTSRSYSCFEKVRNRLLSNEIKFHALVCEKLRADIYADDKNVGGLLFPDGN